MSFTTEIKDELCKINAPSPCCALAECLGMLLYSNHFSSDKIKLQSLSPKIRKRVALIFKTVFGFEPQFAQNSLEISDHSEISTVYNAFGYEYQGSALFLNRAVIEDDCCKNAFLRGAFLIGGYLTARSRGYHLELVAPRYIVAKQVSALLLDMEMPARYVLRRGTHVLYYKDSNMIEDFLSAAGATNSAMTLMLKKVERDLRNNVNRKVNCETANLSKTVEASARQVEAIERLRQSGQLEKLPHALKETAQLRLENPELSLTELCGLFAVPPSRPGLNNRMRRLIELSGKDNK